MLRAYFDDVRWAGCFEAMPRAWPPRVMWWAMAKRLEAVELMGAVRTYVQPGCFEFRRI